MAELVHADADLQVLHQPAASAFTLVVFNINGETPNGGYFWGQDFAARQGLNTLGVMGASNWFPRRAMLAALPALRARITGPVVAYGASMGGYGALKYSALLGASAVLAFAPQFSIDPADVPWDPRWVRHFDPDAHAGMRIAPADLAGHIAVLFDPHDRLDARHAALLPPGPARLMLPFSGHGAVTTVAQAHALPALIDAVREGDMPTARAVLREARRHAHHHLLEMALRRIHLRRYGWVDRIADRMAAQGDTATATLLRACARAGAGNRAEARALAETAASHGTPHRRVQLAYAALAQAL